MEEDLYEKLERLERLLLKLLNRVNELEKLINRLNIDKSSIETAVRLISRLSLPALTALEASHRVIHVLAGLGRYSSLTRNIVESLSDCNPRNVSEITRAVKMLRGTSSRSAIRNRLMELLGLGIVVRVGSGKIAKYTLRSCIEKSE